MKRTTHTPKIAKTIRRLVVAVAAVTAVLAVAAPALAGSRPTYSVLTSSCTPWTGASVMGANFAIRAADLYNGYGENQIVYAQGTLYSYSSGRTIATSSWFWGRAYDYQPARLVPLRRQRLRRRQQLPDRVHRDPARNLPPSRPVRVGRERLGRPLRQLRRLCLGT